MGYPHRIKPQTLAVMAASALTLALAQTAYAQSNAGQVLFLENFGTGTFPTGQALAPGVTSFIFAEPAQPANFNPNLPNNGIVNDGFYTIGTNTQQAFSNWASIEDHTPGDVNGLMLIVNARENETINGQVVEDEFYRQTISLTPNTNFDFETFITPANSVGDEAFCRANFGQLILPNVRFSVEDLSGNVLAENTTGEIPFSPAPNFQPYSLNFTTTTTSPQVQIVLSNIAPGGCGNDLAIDDIEFRIPITAEAFDESANVDDTSAAIPSVFNVVDNDILDGAPFPAPNAPGSNTTLILASDTALPPELSFDVTTGTVGVVQNAPNGVFSFDYLICETDSLVNCARASAEVTIAVLGGPAGGGICPSGQTAISQEGFAIAAFSSNNNQPVSNNQRGNAAGPILDDGAVDTGAQSVQSFFPSIDLEFTEDGDPFLPENSTALLSLAQFFGNSGLALIQSSTDGVNFTDIGTVGFGNNTGDLATLTEQNTFRRIPVIIPAGGARYIRVDHLNGGFRVDGGLRNEICQIQALGPQLIGQKTVESSVTGQFETPGESVVYTISIENAGGSAVDADTIFLVDNLPAQVSFLNLPFSDSAGNSTADPVFFQQFNGAALDFNFARDIGFSSSPAAPTNFGQCTATLSAGPNPAIRHICFNPKGALAAGNPSPSFEFKFAAQIQ